MKIFHMTLVLLAGLLLGALDAKASILAGQRFNKVVYLDSAKTSTQSAANSGRDYASAKGFFDGDLMAIPADVIIDNVYCIIDVAVVGPTAFNIGDDDTASGFIASSAPTATLGGTGLVYWNVDYKGAYLKGGALTATPDGLLAKHYAATGKEVKLDVTGSASAGKMRCVITGYGQGL